MEKLVPAFNSNFDKRTRAGLPSFWDFQGNLLPWDHYEQLLVETKSKVDSSHENTATLKGKTIVNYFQRDFQLLWLVKTLFAANPNYTEITNTRVPYNTLIHTPTTNPTLWKKCDQFLNPPRV